MTDKTKADEVFFDKILSGDTYIANPSDMLINHRAYDIVKYAVIAEQCRRRDLNPDWATDKILINISVTQS